MGAKITVTVLAYAATIHKSQGSEYPAVVVPVLTQHYAMLRRNLLYTGVTRGRRLAVLVGQKRGIIRLTSQIFLEFDRNTPHITSQERRACVIRGRLGKMAKRGPGKAHREGLTVIELFRMFPDDAAAERWFEEQRWPEGRFCPDCGSTNTVAVANRKPMPYRCRDCRGHFSVRKGTVMQSSKIGLQKWVVAIYMMTTGLKGTSSMKLYREVGIRQATAWFLMQRIREGFDLGTGMPFPGPVEADETFIGGKRHNTCRRRSVPSLRGAAGRTRPSSWA